MQASETPEAWESMLLGLAELLKGLASEPGLPELGTDGQAHHLSRDTLQTLLDASASADARSAVLAIAGAQSGSQASADIQSRCLASCIPQKPAQLSPPLNILVRIRCARLYGAWRSPCCHRHAGFELQTSYT